MVGKLRKRYILCIPSAIGSIVQQTHSLFRDINGINHYAEYDSAKITYYPLNNKIANANWENIFIARNKILLHEGNILISFNNYILLSSVEAPIIFGKTIQVNDSIYNWSPSIKVNYSDRNKIVIQYLPLAMFKEKLTYEYALITNNKDTAWQKTNKPEVILLNAAWGKSTLLFRSFNNQYIYSDISKTCLIISPPFYLRWWFLIISICLLLACFYLYTKLKSKKKEQQILEKKEREKESIRNEFKSLNAMMNPHFIFNSLNNIQNLINKNDKEKANDYLVIFSDIVRQNMENIKTELVSLNNELSLVKNYIAIEKLRFSAEITIEIIIDDEVDLDHIKVPPLTIQPLIENSIKHGIMSMNNKNGHILLQIKDSPNAVLIEISDNGVGFEQSKNDSGTKTAIKNISKRLKMLSQMHDKKYALNIIKNSAETNFTDTVQIIIPTK